MTFIYLFIHSFYFIEHKWTVICSTVAGHKREVIVIVTRYKQNNKNDARTESVP